MMLKVRVISSERGYVMLMALIVLLVLSILGAAIIQIGGLESKTSHYDYLSHQAQQGLDAGVEWTMEKIYQELKLAQYADDVSLPATLSFGNPTAITVGTNDCVITIGAISRIEQTSQVGENSCTYQFTSTGTFGNATRTATLQVKYIFTGGYTKIVNNKEVFVERTDFGRGNIKSYLP
jgi:hypothetical protein